MKRLQHRRAVAQFLYRVSSIYLVLSLLAGIMALTLLARPSSRAQALRSTEPERVLTIPYYSIKGDWDSTLTLNNGGHTPLTTSVKLYSLDGEELRLTEVSLQPNDYNVLRLGELVAASQSRGQMQEGSIELRFNSNDPFALAPQLTVSDSKHGLSFDMEPAMGLKSANLEGLWWSLDEKTSGRVMLSNTTADMLNVMLSIEFRSTVNPTSPISLPAHGTVVLEIDKLLKENGIDAKGIERGGLSITHSGLAGALVAHGWIQDEARRFVSSLSFVDPAAQPTSVLDGTGVMLGRSPRDSVFPEGSFFTPQLALKNASGSTQAATVTVRYKTDGRLETRALPVVRLEPHEVRMVDFSRFVAGLGNTPVSEAGLKIESSGEPGSLVASLGSVDQAHSLVVDVPLVSKRDNSAKGGNHPFRLDDNYRSMAYLTNITARPTKVGVIIFYDGKMFTPELINVAAGETVAVDLLRLRDAQTKDIQGRTLPADLRKGQFFWHPHGGEAVAGRVITFDKAAGIVSNFSCPNCCNLEPNRLEFIPAPVAGPVGGSQQLTVNEWDSYCGQFSVGPNNYTNSVAYSCNNTSVATVSSGGLVSCVGLGTAAVTASLNYYHSDNISAEDCGLFPATLTGGCPVEVVSVTIGNLTAVGKDQTADVQVTLTPSPIQSSITLELSATSGTGVAKFDSNGLTTLNISQTTTVTIRGKIESSTADNMKLDAKAGGQSLAVPRIFTVVNVTLSLRTGQGQATSMDNGGRTAYISCVGADSLGTFLQSGGCTPHLWSTGVEVIGTVQPSNYAGVIVLHRLRVDNRIYDGNNNLTRSDSNTPDDSDPAYRDDNPQSGGSNGKVYDLDAPRLGSAPSDPTGTVWRARSNFRQWATLGASGAKVSSDFSWFSRLSIIKIGSSDQLRTDVTGDNTAGLGTTRLTWNLQ